MGPSRFVTGSNLELGATSKVARGACGGAAGGLGAGPTRPEDLKDPAGAGPHGSDDDGPEGRRRRRESRSTVTSPEPVFPVAKPDNHARPRQGRGCWREEAPMRSRRGRRRAAAPLHLRSSRREELSSYLHPPSRSCRTLLAGGGGRLQQQPQDPVHIQRSDCTAPAPPSAQLGDAIFHSRTGCRRQPH